MLAFRLYAIIAFDRPITKAHYLSFGGYEMTMDGKSIQFDFEDYYGTIDQENPHILHVEQRNPDFDVSPDLAHVTETMLRNVESIEEFFVYTGEGDEPEIFVDAIQELAFVIIDDKGKFEQIDIPRKVIDNACICY